MTKLGRVLLVGLLVFVFISGVSADGLRAFDGFEDGDFTNNPSWEETLANGQADVQSQTVKEGKFSLELSTSGSGEEALNYDRANSDTISDGDVYQSWVRWDTFNKQIRTSLSNSKGDALGNDALSVYFNNGDAVIQSFDSSGSFIGSTTAVTGLSKNNWYRYELKITPSQSVAELKIYDDSGNLLGQASQSTSGASNLQHKIVKTRDVNTGSIFIDDVSYSTSAPNNNPKFNNSSISPDPPLIGETADFSYNVSDPDGNISSVNLTLNDDGTQVFTGSKSSASGTFSPPDTLTEGDITAEFTATDNDGATTTEKLTRTLTDTKPVVNISQPSGTFFDYDQNIDVNTQDDGDNNANESLSCNLNLDSSQIDQRTVTEGDNYTVNTRADLGSHNVDVTCTEQDDQQIDTGSTSFTVDNFQFQSLSGASSGKETTEQSFTAGFKAGDMVNNVSFEIVYDGEVRDKATVNVSGVTDSSQGFSHVLNLAQTDGVNRDYNVSAKVDYNNLNTGTSTENVDSSTKSQTVNQAFSYNNSVFEDGLTQLEASTLNFEAQVNKQVTNDRADLSAESTLQQTGETKALDKNGLNFTGVFNTDLINSTITTTNFDTNVTVSFNGESRTFSNTDTLTLEKIQLTKSSSTGPKTLQFETRDEINNSLLDANVEAGITVNNPDQPDKTRFFGFDFSKDKKHKLFLAPSDASITANVFDKRSIVYENLNAGFPKRRHYLTDTKLDNETTNINLYLLEQTKGQTVRLELTNSDLQGLSNHLIRVERAFPDQNETRTVQLAKTGTEGFASTFLQLQERYIFTVFDENGELVDQVGPETVTTTDKRIQVNDDIDPSLANVLNEVQFTDIQRQNQSLSVSYVSETQRLNNLFLKISSDGLFETQTLDVDSSEQPQGQLEVTQFNASEEKVFFELIGTFGETNLTLESGTFGQRTNDFGKAGIFVSFLMFTALTLSGLFRPSAAIGLGVISIFVMSFTGFLAVGQQALLSIAALAAILIWRMSSQ